MDYVDAPGHDTERNPPNFQINISLSAAKFEALLKVALSGRLPAKFYVHAGERVSAWDNKKYRSLLVTNFSMILPISVPEAQEGPAVQEERSLVETLTNN